MSQTIYKVQQHHQGYLSDESRLCGQAESISFPQSPSEIAAIVALRAADGVPITISAGRTGICGGAVPDKGHILNLTSMNKIKGVYQDDQGKFLLKLEAGVTLKELQTALVYRNFNPLGWEEKALKTLAEFKKVPQQFWPPDPSEKSATMGGIAANHACGITAFHYGPTRHYIDGIKVIDAGSRLFEVKRGDFTFTDRRCPLPGCSFLTVEPNSIFLGDNPDLIDIYIGSEGMYGVITELTIPLIPRPKELWGIALFFEKWDQSGSIY